MSSDGPIAIAFDGSAPSRVALAEAAALAVGLGRELVLFEVVDSAQMTEAHEAAEDHPVSHEAAAEAVAEHRAQAEAELWPELERLASGDGLNVRFEVLEGRPGPAIVSRAAELDCSLVAMGTRGRSGLVRALLGSVADEVVRHAHCPVLLVRDDSEESSSS